MNQLTAGIRTLVDFVLRREINIQELAGLGTRTAASEAFHEDFKINIQEHGGIQRSSELIEQFLEVVGLLLCARETIQDKTLGRIRLRQSFGDNAEHDVIGDEIAGIDYGFRLSTKSTSGSDCFTQHIPRGNMRDACLAR